jgi:hypothetical protein
MSIVEDNIDRFQVHPTYALAALFPDREHVDRMIETVASELDDEVVEVIHGEEGLRILDERGVNHGLSARLHRLLQNWTYYRDIFAFYSERLADGEFLMIIPCDPERRSSLARAARSLSGHRIYYFGYGTVESIVER